jgi:alcohol dehydrogenase class IV
VLAEPADPEAREELALGCLASSLAMANANAGAIHALGYPLTLHYGVAHGLANALVAPAALARLWPARPERYGELAALLRGRPGGRTGAGGGAEIPRRVRAFLAAVGVAGTLRERGIPEDALPLLAREATGFRPILDNTPLALTEADLLAIYRAAWSGEEPPYRPRAISPLST